MYIFNLIYQETYHFKKTKIMSIQRPFPSFPHLMVISHIHLLIYFLECTRDSRMLNPYFYAMSPVTTLWLFHVFEYIADRYNVLLRATSLGHQVTVA